MFRKTKIRVLQCIRQGKIGGGESHLLNLVANLDRENFEPVVLSFTNGPMLERLEEMSVPNKVIYTERPFDFTKWRKVRDFLKEEKIDLIHAHGTRANSNVFWAAKSLNIPVIYTIHGWSFHPDQSFFVRRLRILGEKYLTKSSRQNISVSIANQNDGKKNIAGFRSVLINYGIDQNKFQFDRRYNDVKSELGIDKDCILVVFIARFTKQKQPLAIVEAFAKAVLADQRLHLLMVGDGELKLQVEKLVEGFNLKDNVTLQPFRQDVPAILSAADIFVLPSIWEGLPIGLLEAMTMGKAIVASNVDGTPEVITDNENGILVDTSNLIDGFKEGILRLSRDELIRKKFGEAALTTVRKNFNVVDMTRKIEEVYFDILVKAGATEV